MFTVVATALIGTWLIPSIIAWTKSKSQHKSLRQYRRRLDLLNSNKSSSQIRQESPDKLSNDITTAYSRGKINELQHEILKQQILQYHQERISKKIESLKNVSNLSNDEYIQVLDKTTRQLKDAYSEGKINGEHYVDLKNEISIHYEEIYRKRIDSVAASEDREGDRGKALRQMKSEIGDAFAKGKITDQHYDLLNKKIVFFLNTSDTVRD